MIRPVDAVRHETLAFVNMSMARDGDATTFRVHGGGFIIGRVANEFGIARAGHVYQRLGYRAAGRQHASWETEDDAGVLRVCETTLTILRKRL